MTSAIGRLVVDVLTNKSGGAVAYGDVVVLDSANDDAFTTDTSGAFTGIVGVCIEPAGIASNASGRIQTQGPVAQINCSASVTRGHYLKTHTVAKQAADAGTSRVVGAFAKTKTTSATPKAILFGFPDAASSSASAGTPGVTLSTTNSPGVAATFVATDATIAAFDATSPTTQAAGDAAVVGTAGTAARRDHKHAMFTPDVVMLADSLLGSDTASFDFTSISGSYKHLRIELQGRSDNASTVDFVRIRFNNDSGANYDHYVVVWGSATSMPPAGDAFGETSAKIGAVVGSTGSSAGDVGNLSIVIPDYASTTFNKSAHSEGGAMLARTAGNARLIQGFASWRSTAAITRVTLIPAAGTNFKLGSRATLYGIK